MKLVRYDAACRALAAAKSTDEVKRIRDSAAALRAYAKQAKNKQLEIDAAEIRIRAERRVGELMAAQRQSIGLSEGGRPKKTGSKSDPVSPTLTDAGIDKHLADRARKLAAVPAPEFEQQIGKWRARSEQAAERVTATVIHPKGSNSNVHFSSDTPEHYTPETFLAAVREVFGDVPDLDPCSNSRTTPNVAAHAHYTADDDGLAQPWRGRVFVNPPYGRDIQAWTEKMRQEWARGKVLELIALLPARTDTEWFDGLTGDSDDAIVCFLRGRLTFVGNSDPAPFPSVAVYFGARHDRFAAVFVKLGSLWQRPGRPLEWFVSNEER